jgi:hypothetical protein
LQRGDDCTCGRRRRPGFGRRGIWRRGSLVSTGEPVSVAASLGRRWSSGGFRQARGRAAGCSGSGRKLEVVGRPNMPINAGRPTRGLCRLIARDHQVGATRRRGSAKLRS